MFYSPCSGAGNNPPLLPLQSCVRDREESCPETLVQMKLFIPTKEIQEPLGLVGSGGGAKTGDKPGQEMPE